MVDPMACNCLMWARVTGLDDKGHHPTCPHHPDQMAALMSRLVKGIEEWAGYEDGVPECLSPAYDAAKALLAPQKCIICNGRGNHGSVNPALYKGDTCSACKGTGQQCAVPVQERSIPNG